MGTLFSLSKSATSTALEISEIALLLFGILLVVGLIGEYAESEKWKRYVKVFEMFVIIGVAGELFADGGIFLFSSHLQTIAEQEIADLTRETGGAKISAEGAALAASSAKDSADKANIAAGKATDESGKATVSASKALTLARGARSEADSFETDIKSAKTQAAEAVSHLADALQRAANAEREIVKLTLELKRLKTPRGLNEEQLRRIKSKIQPFRGTLFDLWVSTDPDSTALLELIDGTLRSVGWEFKPTGIPILYNNKAGVIAFSGVFLHIPQEHRSEWEPAVLALGNALVAEGIATTAVADTADAEKGMARDRIHVMIGSKPPD